MRRLDGVLQGDHRTLMRGAGLDLADLREYQHHDDVRHIDWNVTARLQTPYVRQFTEDRELSALVPRRPLGERRLRLEPLHQAQGRARVRRRPRAPADAPRQPRRRPALRQRRRHRAAGARRPRPRARAAAADGGAPGRGGGGSDRPARAAARRAAHRQAPLDALRRLRFHQRAGLGEALGQLAQRHEVTAVRLFDALEMDLPDLGLVTMQRRRDRRADRRRHPRPGLPRALRRRRREARDAACASRSRAPASIPSSSAPTTTWSTPCCASPTSEAAQPARQLERRGAALDRARPPGAARMWALP